MPQPDPSRVVIDNIPGCKNRIEPPDLDTTAGANKVFQNRTLGNRRELFRRLSSNRSCKPLKILSQPFSIGVQADLCCMPLAVNLDEFHLTQSKDPAQKSWTQLTQPISEEVFVTQAECPGGPAYRNRPECS